MRHIITKTYGHRVETEAVMFNDDWKGLFIRGDDCISLLEEIDKCLETRDIVWHDEGFLRRLKEEIENVVLK